MTLPDIDWRYLTRGLELRLAMVAATLLLLGVTLWMRGDYASQAQLEREQLDGLDQQRNELQTRVLARVRFERRYLELQAAGVIGEEQRLAWTEALRASADAARLPYLRYSATPRVAFEAPYLQAGTTAPVQATTMDLQIGMIHEMDLLRLLAHLRESAPGLISVSACSLSRDGTGGLRADVPNITGSCQLRWYTIPPPGTAVEAMAMAEAGE